MTDSNCKKKLKLDIAGYAAEIIKKSGCAVYVQFAATFNSAIATVVTSLRAYLTVTKALFTLDDLVLNTFVLPPMNAAIDALDFTKKQVAAPMAQIGASSNECSDTAAVSKSTSKLRDLATFDVTWLSNSRDGIEMWMREDSLLQKQLEDAVKFLDDMATFLPASCEEFKAKFPDAFKG